MSDGTADGAGVGAMESKQTKPVGCSVVGALVGVLEGAVVICSVG
jgi:surface antigen